MKLGLRIAHAASRCLPAERRIAIMRWFKGRAQRSALEKADIVLVSFPKSGRTWFRVMLSRCYAHSFGLNGNILIKGDNFRKLDGRAPVFLSFHGSFIQEVAGGRDPASLFRGKKVILLVRHPIDTSVSCYFHLLGGRTKTYNREMKGVPADIKNVPIEDFVLNSAWSVGAIVKFLNEWTALAESMESVLVVSYERLTEDAHAEMGRVNRFLNGPFTQDALASAIESSTFEKLKAQEQQGAFENAALRPRDAENPHSFKVRRGKVGGYREYLSAACIEKSERKLTENLAPQLGYR